MSYNTHATVARIRVTHTRARVGITLIGTRQAATDSYNWMTNRSVVLEREHGRTDYKAARAIRTHCGCVLYYIRTSI